MRIDFLTAGRRVEYVPTGRTNRSCYILTGVTTGDGRVTIMMPHSERAFRAVLLSYHPFGVFQGEDGPWLRLFQNARRFVG